MGKIIKLGQVKSSINPNTATLVGGAFDLFHVGHLRYLARASECGRPLVVIVQTDKMVSIRKGLNRPVINQNHRADIIASLYFVDYVLILDRPAHYEEYLEVIQPKNLVFFKENMIYRKRRALEIEKKFPSIRVVFLSVKKKAISTSSIIKKILEKPNFEKIKHPIARRLHELASHCQSKIGKISAILFYKGKLVEEAFNNKLETHAEALLFKQAKKHKIPIEKCDLYILIPPCIMCSELILKNKVKNVFYLHSYGNDDGLKLLKNHRIFVKKIS